MVAVLGPPVLTPGHVFSFYYDKKVIVYLFSKRVVNLINVVLSTFSLHMQAWYPIFVQDDVIKHGIITYCMFIGILTDNTF